MGSYSFLLAIIVIVSFLLVVVIMVQNPKGGGLASTFGGGGTQQLGGVKQTTDFLDKSTWTLAIILIALIMLSNLTFDKGENRIESKALDSNELIQEPIPLDQPPVEIDPDNQ